MIFIFVLVTMWFSNNTNMSQNIQIKKNINVKMLLNNKYENIMISF